MTNPWQFSFSGPSRVVFGDGVLDEAGTHLPFASRVLIVAGKTSAVKSGCLDRLVTALSGKEVSIFTGVSPNPRVAEVNAAAAQGLSAGVQAVIGIGGGSALDAAKATAAAIAGADISAHLREDRAAPDATLPIVTIPTTAGTGTETSQAAILSDETAGVKQGLRGAALIPRVAIIDPGLLVSLPQTVAAETGFDVLTHALETWVSRRSSALTQLYSRHAISSVFRWLPVFLDDRDHRLARQEMSMASMLMGWNLSNSTTALPHRLQYPVGARTDTSHPAGLAALYPAWTLRACLAAPEPFEFIASLAGKTKARDGRDHLLEFMAAIGVTRRLADFGLTKADAPALAREVRGNLSTDPCDSSLSSLEELYSASV
jgi:alcohol dehydrogenase class IV